MPGPLNFNTPERVITYAMVDAGLLQEGEIPNSQQLASYLVRLNDLVNLWQTQGLKLWVNELVNVTLTAGTANYQLGPGGSILTTKPARVLEAYYYNSTGNSYPLTDMAWNDYNMLSNKSQQGAINSYFQDKQLNNINVTFWLVPDSTAATGYVQLLVQEQIANMVSLNDSMSFPQEWFMALRWGLADDISTGQPQPIIDRCAQRAKAFREALESWDLEDASTRFTPDPRMVYPTQRYR